MKYRVINSHDVLKINRFDGSYHNAEVNVYDEIIKSHSDHNLAYYCSTIFTSGRARRMYTKQEFGYPFLSNADVASQNPLSACNYASKKYSYDETAFLKGGMILTGRVGAIGQTSFVPKFWERYGMMGSDNIIRIVVKPEHKNGFIYAYLASKVGNLSFWKHATGGVQPFITDKMVGNLPIPNFPDSFQKEVDDLVQQSATLREQAAAKLDEAKKIVDDYCDNAFKKTDGFKYQAVKSTKINSSYKTRIDAPFFINDGVEWTLSSTKKTVRLGDLDITSWYPGIFKRIYVQNGYPYIKGSSLFETNPFRRCDQLSKSRTPMLDQLGLKEGMLMMSCAGICGQVKMITKEYEEKGAIGSPDIIRLISNDSLITTEYLFVYFQLPAVYDFLQSLKYGSVIERFDIGNIENTPIVEPSKELSAKTTELVKQYMDCTYRAFCAEEKAITMVEEEIEKWQSPTA
jgi:hypothetical protein